MCPGSRLVSVVSQSPFFYCHRSVLPKTMMSPALLPWYTVGRAGTCQREREGRGAAAAVWEALLKLHIHGGRVEEQSQYLQLFSLFSLCVHLLGLKPSEWLCGVISFKLKQVFTNILWPWIRSHFLCCPLLYTGNIALFGYADFFAINKWKTDFKTISTCVMCI